MNSDPQIFALARKDTPNFAEKVVAVGGELCEENLGLSAEDMEMLINKFVVFEWSYLVELTLCSMLRRQ